MQFDTKLSLDGKFQYDPKDTAAWLLKVKNYFIGQCPDAELLLQGAEAKGHEGEGDNGGPDQRAHGVYLELGQLPDHPTDEPLDATDASAFPGLGHRKQLLNREKGRRICSFTETD